MRGSAMVLLGSILIALMMAQPVQATMNSITYADEQGDLARWRYVVSIDPYNYVLGPPLPQYSTATGIGYCDIIEAGLELVDDDYVFSMKVAGDMPSKGIIPGVHYVIWSFCPQFDPPGPDFNFWNGGDVALQWDGKDYRAVFWDTRPVMQTGNPADILEIPVEYEVVDSTLTVKVPVKLFGVDNFYWYFRVVVLGGQYDFYTFKGGPYIVVDITDPQYAMTPYPGYYMPWLPWPAT